VVHPDDVLRPGGGIRPAAAQSLKRAFGPSVREGPVHAPLDDDVTLFQEVPCLFFREDAEPLRPNRSRHSRSFPCARLKRTEPGEPVGESAVEDPTRQLRVPVDRVLPESGARFHGVHVEAEPKERRGVAPGPGAHVEHLLSGFEHEREK